ncbi:hypothetical protein hp2017_12082 [Helicobacter pylori 2017]|nr:hypothetical protein hp2017_12082 [Helicobacter pylori 2017]
MKSSLKLFMQPLLVVLAFMLLYALAHAVLGFYVKKDSAPISQNLEKSETERQNSALSPKEETNATTTATEQSHTKDTAPPLETAAQNKRLNKSKKKKMSLNKTASHPFKTTKKPPQPPQWEKNL